MSITKTSVATSLTKVEHPENTDAGSIIVFGPISPDFSRFPLDIVRLILEASVRHSVSGDDDNFCRRAAYAYCFISKEVKAWIEPVLYEHIVLESSNQVVGFLDALEYKSPAFLARAVKSVSVLDDSFPVNETFKFERLFSRCQSLTKLVCLGSSMRILRTISALSTVPHALRELTIIQPSSAHYLFIQHLSLQKLHIVDFCGTFLGTLNEMARKDKKLLTALRSIRRSFWIPYRYRTTTSRGSSNTGPFPFYYSMHRILEAGFPSMQLGATVKTDGYRTSTSRKMSICGLRDLMHLQKSSTTGFL